MAKKKVKPVFGIQTRMGNLYDPKSGRINFIDIEDIAHALSNIGRYAGHSGRFYSVAEHSVLVAEIAQTLWPEDADAIWAALLHDATEAYLTDLPTPIKILLPKYNEMEASLTRKIAKRFSVKWNSRTEARVKQADSIALFTEVPFLFEDLEKWDNLKDKFSAGMPALFKAKANIRPAEAKALFLKKFKELL